MALLSAIANPQIADVAGSFEQGRQIGQQRLTKDLAGEILNETLGSKLGMQAYQDLQKVNPDVAMKLKQALQTDSDSGTQYFLGVTKASASIIDGGGTAQDVSRYLAAQAPLALEGGRPEIAQKMMQASKMLLDPNQADEVIRNMMATAAGFSGNTAMGTSEREFNNLISGFSAEDQTLAKEIKAGLKGRASSDALMTAIANGTLPEYLAAIEGKAQSGETGTQKAKLFMMPQVTAAVDEAKRLAKDSGETFTDLTRMNAALPGLQSTIGQLKNLSLIATSTMGGRVFDMASKELGFGSTKGANAAAKFTAIVNNQVLPLLKPTFGAAFTVQEGESLRATLGDVNASPDQKLATLDAFLAQKEQDILTKGREVESFSNGLDTSLAPPTAPSKSRFKIEVVN